MTALFRHLIGGIGLILLTINIVVWMIPIIILSILKFIIPITVIRNLISSALNLCASAWISVNSLMAKYHVNIKVTWPENIKLSPKDWYLVLANHQSWVDIYVLQNVFNRKIPFLKFFLKKELIYVPLLGIAWWALDFPFMKRHSKEYLKKHPEKKGQDLETTKKACEKFQHIPISVMNFVEGTRFTEAKSQRQNSPYSQLLKPKSGGVGTVLSILGDKMHHVLDVTLHYPRGIPSFWDFLCGRVGEINVVVEQHEVKSYLVGDMTNAETRIQVQGWLNELWQHKDQLLTDLSKTNSPLKPS
ncbi:acyltransferase [Pleionea litopenaei]|uniref:Acyltransferase n=1 Tax=Pleionea litopenaei TaxID=3070815 RepID=A0AA51RR74_9GAMM|nr:acyltransferase [Pleionea sp. HL-JVS1]WMS86115.1 acyltransferase [Pleionea sp. HL-JVS1]